MELWQRIFQVLDKSLPLSDNLSNISDLILTNLPVDACNIFIKDSENIFTLVSTTLTPLLSGLIHIHIKHDAVGQAVLREEMVLIEDTYNYKIRTTLSAFSREKLKCLLCAPIIHQRKVIGIIALQNNNKNDLTENIQTTLVTLCLNISSFISSFIAKDQKKLLMENKSKQDKTLFLSGKTVTSGTAIGQIIQKYNILDFDEIPEKETQNDNEIEQFHAALNNVKQSITIMLDQIQIQASENEAALFDAYLQILDSNSYSGEILKLMKSGVWIQTAIKKITEQQVNVFKNMSDPYLQSRASDISDLSQRILLQLQESTPLKQNYSSETILLAHEVTPSMVAEIPKGRLKAIISEKGTETSHASILARALGIPFIINVASLPTEQIEGKIAIVDAYAGKIYINPNKGILSSYKRLILTEQEKESMLKEVAPLPCIMLDGHQVDVQANVGFIADLDIAIEKGASGIGLYRTEIPFMIRDKFPSEDEQRVIYSQFLKAFPDKPVTIRTLDVGSDKALPYFTEQEENPALGWRGIRMLLDHTNIFLIQIRAMLRASEKTNNLRILLPMVTDIQEIKESIKLIKRARKELLEDGFHIKNPQIGIMIEVPSIIFQISHILEFVHFVSVGTNDLTQYILAIDRNNQKVSHLYSQLHPSVIQALYQIAEKAKQNTIHASICGELAGNPLAAPILIGMGYNSLSMNPVNILKIKWIMRSLSYEKCKSALNHTLKLHTTVEIETYLTNFLIENNLANMIRAGN